MVSYLDNKKSCLCLYYDFCHILLSTAKNKIKQYLLKVVILYFNNGIKNLKTFCGRRYIRSLPDSFPTSVKPYLERRRRKFPELYLVPIPSSPIGGS